MKKIASAIVFFVLAMSVGAQNIVTISGTVIDAKNGQPLPYCNCFLKHSNSGTSTGAEGVFSLKLKNTLLPDTLVIQFIGYESAEFPLAKKNKDLGKIQLKPRDTELKEITVKGRITDWNKVLKAVFDSCIYKAYPSPSVATTYYKETTNYSFEEKVEVALDVVFPEKQKKRRNRNGLLFSNCGKPDESFFVKGLRKTNRGKIDPHPEKTHNYYGIFDCNGLSLLLNSNIYFNKNIMFEKEMEKARYTLKRIDTIDGNKVITLYGNIRKHNKSTEMKICFDPQNHIIYYYEVSFISYSKKGESSETIKYNYRVANGYAIPLNFSHVFTEDGKTTKFVLSEEVLFSDIRPVTDSTEFAGEKASGKNSFEFQGLIYDKEFWDNYTVIE